MGLCLLFALEPWANCFSPSALVPSAVKRGPWGLRPSERTECARQSVWPRARLQRGDCCQLCSTSARTQQGRCLSWKPRGAGEQVLSSDLVPALAGAALSSPRGKQSPRGQGLRSHVLTSSWGVRPSGPSRSSSRSCTGGCEQLCLQQPSPGPRACSRAAPRQVRLKISRESGICLKRKRCHSERGFVPPV